MDYRNLIALLLVGPLMDQSCLQYQLNSSSLHPRQVSFYQWSSFQTCTELDIFQRGCMWERKCLESVALDISCQSLTSMENATWNYIISIQNPRMKEESYMKCKSFIYIFIFWEIKCLGGKVFLLKMGTRALVLASTLYFWSQFNWAKHSHST